MELENFWDWGKDLLPERETHSPVFKLGTPCTGFASVGVSKNQGAAYYSVTSGMYQRPPPEGLYPLYDTT